MTQNQNLSPEKLRKTIPFNVMLDANEDRLLKELARHTGLSRGLCLRQALRAMHAMLVTRIPTCANGNNCFVPQMHPQLPPRPAA